MKVSSSILIQAPIVRVFDVFTDFQNAAERIQGINKIEFLEKDGRPELGMKWRETRTMFGKEATEEMWITEINENQNYVVEAESHGTHYRSEYVFSESNGITTVAMTFEGKPLNWIASVGSLMSIVFAGSIKKMLRADMEDLKRVIETE